MFKPAVKEKLKCRLAIEGPSGSGKSLSALLIARGLVGEGGKIAMIDTEKDSGKLYADTTPFDHASLSAPYTPERYNELIVGAEKAGYDCIIIDSISHEWMGPGGVLEIHDAMPGNSWTNWAKVNPRHDSFIEAILNSKCHIITTMRSKQAYTQEAGNNGKQQVKKLGMAPQQRDGMEYEFTAVIKMDTSHQAEGDKDRTGLFPVGEWFVPTIETGTKLGEWLGSGIDPNKMTVNKFEKGIDFFPANGKPVEALQKWFDGKADDLATLTDTEQAQVKSYLKQIIDVMTEDNKPTTVFCPQFKTEQPIEDCRVCELEKTCEEYNVELSGRQSATHSKTRT